jgi:hypothetical protein
MSVSPNAARALKNHQRPRARDPDMTYLDSYPDMTGCPLPSYPEEASFSLAWTGPSFLSMFSRRRWMLRCPSPGAAAAAAGDDDDDEDVALLPLFPFLPSSACTDRVPIGAVPSLSCVRSYISIHNSSSGSSILSIY